MQNEVQSSLKLKHVVNIATSLPERLTHCGPLSYKFPAHKQQYNVLLRTRYDCWIINCVPLHSQNLKLSPLSALGCKLNSRINCKSIAPVSNLYSEIYLTLTLLTWTIWQLLPILANGGWDFNRRSKG